MTGVSAGADEFDDEFDDMLSAAQVCVLTSAIATRRSQHRILFRHCLSTHV